MTQIKHIRMKNGEIIAQDVQVCQITLHRQRQTRLMMNSERKNTRLLVTNESEDRIGIQ